MNFVACDKALCYAKDKIQNIDRRIYIIISFYFTLHILYYKYKINKWRKRIMAITKRWAVTAIERDYDGEWFDWFEEVFMDEVCIKLIDEHCIVSEPSTQWGGRCGHDFLFTENEDGEVIAEASWEINAERECLIEEAIETSDSFEEAVDKAVAILKSYYDVNNQPVD